MKFIIHDIKHPDDHEVVEASGIRQALIKARYDAPFYMDKCQSYDGMIGIMLDANSRTIMHKAESREGLIRMIQEEAAYEYAH